MVEINDNELKQIKNQIIDLEDFQQDEIFKILEKNNIKYTQNNNGVFLNMKLLDELSITQFKEYLLFIDKQKLI
tara:strand:+ start:171 stop:392 length:222 start_codon:yes stop_codon:yes gene_type:complete